MAMTSKLKAVVWFSQESRISWRTINANNVQTSSYLNEALAKYQHKTIDSVLDRGERLDSLVEKSSDLSAASQVLPTAFVDIFTKSGLVTSRMSSSLYLVFEFMEHDLVGILGTPGNNLIEPQVKCYMQQLLRGLEHCHHCGVLHRDIKGSNLLINNNVNLEAIADEALLRTVTEVTKDSFWHIVDDAGDKTING